MATSVRGLCTSSIARASTSRRDTSTSRTNLEFTARAAPRSSRKCRNIVFAVLVDPKVQSPPTSTTRIELEEAPKTGIESEQTHLQFQFQFVDSPDSQTRNIPKPRSENLKLAPAVMGLTDTNLKSTPEHQLWVAFGATVVTGMLTKASLACESPEAFLQLGAGAFAAYILSDLGTGIYHWGIDNYGDASTPVFGAQIDAFQGHHQRPWTITKREFANNVHAIARPAGLFLTPFLLLPSQPFGDSFLALFLGLVVMSQQIHAWAHMKKSQLPEWVVKLQDGGALLGRKMHGTHHKPPYDINYCIVSGWWNPVLNETEVFKRLERWIYGKWGVAPRAWSETSDEWLAMDSYFEDGTEFDPSHGPSS